MNFSTSTTTRVTLPAATRPRSSDAETEDLAAWLANIGSTPDDSGAAAPAMAGQPEEPTTWGLLTGDGAGGGDAFPEGEAG